MLDKKKLGDRMPPIFLGGFLIGEIILIFTLTNLYVLTKAKGSQEKPTKVVGVNAITQTIRAKHFPFPIQWPVIGVISQDFSPSHPGLDIQATYGAQIKPFAPGFVTETGYKLGYGQTIQIRHKGGYSSNYAHLAQIYVTQNQPVGLTTKLGSVGTSGWTTGAHLHLEIFQEEEKIDPKNLLP